MSWLAEKFDAYFKLTERGTTIGTEFRAGTVTFMTMAYILLVNPTILSGSGMPFRPVASATAVSAIIACTFVGLVANLPFGLGPGMGLNAYFAFGVCVANNMSYGIALAACAVNGVVGVARSPCSTRPACEALRDVRTSACAALMRRIAPRPLPLARRGRRSSRCCRRAVRRR